MAPAVRRASPPPRAAAQRRREPAQGASRRCRTASARRSRSKTQGGGAGKRPKRSASALLRLSSSGERKRPGSAIRAALAPGSGKSARDLLADGSPCPFCPEMVVVPAGTFAMGSPANEPERSADEAQVRVTIAARFAVGKYAVTFDE